MASLRYLVGFVFFAIATGAFSVRADWRQFRGTDGNGSAGDQQPPLEWNVKTGSGIPWTLDLPGRGPSSPIVVGERVIVTCSSGYRQDRLHVLCIDAQHGRLLWERQFWATGRSITHASSANAAPTPASDGQSVYALFSSNDLICLDLQGNLRWLRGLAHEFPRAGNDIGMASSPVVIDGTVVVQIENQGDSFAAGIDAQNGSTRWRIEREHKSNWSSPLGIRAPRVPSTVVMTSTDGIKGFDPQDGHVRWSIQTDAGGIPSVIAQDNRLYAPVNGLLAVQLGAGSPDTLWTAKEVQPSAASPVFHRGNLYCISRGGVVNCVDSLGKRKWQLRLSRTGNAKVGTFWASPVAAHDYLYCVSDEGAAFVVQTGDQRKDGQGVIVAENDFGEPIQATPAVAHQAIYVRSNTHLWKVAHP